MYVLRKAKAEKYIINENYISNAETNLPFGQQEGQPPFQPVQESDHGTADTTWFVYYESLRSMLQGDSQGTHHSPYLGVIHPTTFVPLGVTLPQESTNEGAPEELVISGRQGHLFNRWSTHESVATLIDPRPPPTYRFLNVGEVGDVWKESEAVVRWKFGLRRRIRVEDIVCISSPLFTNQFGDKVYVRLYINSDGTRYQANATSIFLVTVARAKQLQFPLNIIAVLRDSYFTLDSHSTFSLGRDDSVVQAVHGCQKFVSVTQLQQSTGNWKVCLGIQFFI